MEPRQDTILRAVFLLGVASSVAFGQAGLQKRISFEEYIRETVPTRPEIDVFLNETSWAQFDQDIGYILGNYINMNLVHIEDFKSFNLSIDAYFQRYFIGHYNPAGNHFFAYSIKDRCVEWLDPKPITYEENARRMTEFKGYLQDY